ncbi:hypothetical protein HMPREF3190_01735, partial [Umbribacter vaginalis]
PVKTTLLQNQWEGGFSEPRVELPVKTTLLQNLTDDVREKA